MAEKNLMAFSDDTYDSHGGKAEAHHAEMEMIARRVYAEEREKDMQIIRAEMEERCSQAYRQAIKDLLHAVQYDVESITRIGIDGCREIFEDSRAQKFISDQIMQEIAKKLNNKNFHK